MVVAGVAARDPSLEDQCVVRLEASDESPWKKFDLGPKTVSLEEVRRLVRKYRLTLVEGPPPQNYPQALVSVSCERHGPMWVGLPQRIPSSYLKDDSATPCWYQVLKEDLYVLLGWLPEKPKQYANSPRREYMRNYCGKSLPVSKSTNVTKLMDKITKKIEKCLEAVQF